MRDWPGYISLLQVQLRLRPSPDSNQPETERPAVLAVASWRRSSTTPAWVITRCRLGRGPSLEQSRKDCSRSTVLLDRS